MKTGVVEKKKYRMDYEAGSGSLYIPILGDLFPNLWGQKMYPVDKWFLVINNTEYIVEKDVYDNIAEGDIVEIYYDNGFPKIKYYKGN